MLENKKKARIIKKYQTHEGDTGSSEVQIALLTAEIEELVGHLKAHHKDHSSRRGLLRKVNTRRRLMRFLKKENLKSYEELVKKLKLKEARKIAKKEDKGEILRQAQDDNVFYSTTTFKPASFIFPSLSSKTAVNLEVPTPGEFFQVKESFPSFNFSSAGVKV